MIITAELLKDKVIVKKPKEVGRLYNKSHIGRPLSKGYLELNLIEAVFLSDEDKIKIFSNEKEIDFEKLIKIASKNIKKFDTKYFVYKDLRRRGHAIILNEKDGKYNFKKFLNKEEENCFYVCVFSEKDFFDIKKTKDLLDSLKKDESLWFAIVDEEGDITYYNVSYKKLKGENKTKKYSKIKTYLLDDKVLVFNEKSIKELFETEFFGKIFGKALQLSYLEAYYLLKNKSITIFDKLNKKILEKDLLKQISKDRAIIYNNLKKNGLIPKTGFKFGTHFRAYTKHPDKIHAEYLVHVVDKNFKSIWAEFSRAVRLAHSVNKEIVFASIIKDKVEYINFGRLRP